MTIAEQYLDIPLDQLHDSPTQPRLVYDDAYLDELAANLKSHGRNLSPLLVRPIVPALFAAQNDPELSRAAQAGYEIVFGHCRKRGLERAGLLVARCEVRTMTDEEVERAQISENLQRKNVHPFEEAQAYQALIDRHGDTADAIAARTGKSRTYIYSRLKLLQACAEVRKACLAGEIDAEVALLVARLRSDKLQGKALARVSAKAWDLKDGGKRSFRNIRDLLNEEFTLDLKAAPFPIDVVLAGSGPCPTCPKRSANAPEYQDVAEGQKRSQWSHQNLGPNVCTDPECFAARKTAHFANQAAELRRKGRTVIDGNKARALVGADGKVKGGYLPLASVKDEMKRAKAKLIFVPTEVAIQCPRTGKIHEAVKESELVAAGVRTASTARPDATGHRSSAQAMQDRADREEQATAKTARNRAWLLAVREAASLQARSEFDLRLICHHLLERADDNGESGLDMLLDVRGVRLHELRGQIELLPASELALLMLDLVLAEGCEVDSWNLDDNPAALMAAGAHYGVNLDAITAEVASTPSPAARASNGTADEDDEGDVDDAEENAQGSSQAGSAGNEKGAGVAGDAGLQGEEQGATA